MPKPFVEAAALNHKGNVRQNNEDSFYLDGVFMAKEDMNKGGLFRKTCQSASQIYSVCDGMGGEAAGEEASFAAVQYIAQHRSVIKDIENPDKLKHFVCELSNKVYEVGQTLKARCGTTTTICLIRNDKARLLHVGDSRIYRLHNLRLEQMTVDHSEVQRMVTLGLISQEEAKVHPKRHVISQHLGMSPQEVTVEPGLSDLLTLEENDRYLLCSDGLTDMVPDEAISEAMTNAATAAEACDTLVRLALKNGGRDNVTVLTLFIGAVGKREKWKWPALLALSAGALALLAEIFYRLL